MEEEKRKFPRIDVAVPIRFNLDPDYHYVPTIRKSGVTGRVQNISPEGFKIDARMDLLDICQIFPEDPEEGAAFVLDVFFVDFKGNESVIKAEVRWYELGEPEDQIRQFRAGLYLRDPESRGAVRNMRLA
jgi:hypothetical protein